MTEQQRRLAEFLKSRGAAGAIVRRRANIAWLTGGADTHIDGSSRFGIAALRWSPSEKTVVTDNIEASRLAAEEFGDDWTVAEHPWWEPEPSRETEGWLDDAGDDVYAELRWSLAPSEIETVRELGADATRVLEGAMKRARTGMTEHELAGDVVGGLRALGIFTPVMLVAADERIRRFRHPIPTGHRVERVVMAAICAQRKGLTVSATRLVHFGPLDADLDRRHDAVCHVEKVMHDTTRPGRTWGELFTGVQDAYADAGFPDEWKLHHQGGPMGYELREFKAAPGETRTVVENQLVGWNPTVTGTKAEDTILSSGDVVTPSHDWPMRGSRPDILVRS